MTLYKGENVEDVLEELESFEYRIKARAYLRSGGETQIVRPIFQLIEDDDGCFDSEPGEVCICFPYPSMPLASTTWDEEAERTWLDKGLCPQIPDALENEHRKVYFALLDERRARRMKYGAEED